MSTVSPDPMPALRQRLVALVRDSLQRHHAPFVTCRQDDRRWIPVTPGLHIKPLLERGGVAARMVELQPGARWPAMPAPYGRFDERLVIAGELHGGELSLRAPAWLLTGPERHAPLQAGADGALVFSRSIAPQTVAELPSGEAAWWPADADAWQLVTNPDGWLPFAPGIMLCPLRAAGDVLSMLVRFERGARVPAHGHLIDEHCLMLEGDLFLGDQLLRRGEYQLAPAGSEHGELMSDVGCLLYFHGGIDPALRGG